MNTITNNTRSRRLTVVFAILCVIMSASSLQARPIAEQDVRAAARTWVRQVTAEPRHDAVIERLEPHVVDGDTVAYIAHLEGGGFCLCGADNLTLPVYFYCPKGIFDRTIPDLMYILGDITDQLRYLQEELRIGGLTAPSDQQILSDQSALWQDLAAGFVPERSKETTDRDLPQEVDLGLTSAWHQRSPYNDECPNLTPGADDHVAVGCVATAMAQIMYYWQWPSIGMGQDFTTYHYRWRDSWAEKPCSADPGYFPPGWIWDGRLEWTEADGGKVRMNGYWDQTLFYYMIDEYDWVCEADLYNMWSEFNVDSSEYSANFGATIYDFSLMHDKHTDPPDAGDQAAARLCYHAGVAAHMDYGLRGSGAYMDTAVMAMTSYFRYDSDAVLMGLDVDWMTTEILWQRPLLFAGYKFEAGHAWVVFGYFIPTTGNTLFKMNMGWGENYIGWYTLTTVPGDYEQYQAHSMWLAPEDIVRFVGSDFSGDGSPNNPHRNIGEALADAPEDATLVFLHSTVQTLPEGMTTLTGPLTLRGAGVTIRRQ